MPEPTQTQSLHSTRALLRQMDNQTPPPPPPHQPLITISPSAQNNVTARFILLDKAKPTIDGQNKTCLALVADETASVHFQLWGGECDAFEPGDILYLEKGIFSYVRANNTNNSLLLLRAGKRGKVVKVGEFTAAFVETPNLSEIDWVVDPASDSRRYVMGSVISSYSRVFGPPR